MYELEDKYIRKTKSITLNNAIRIAKRLNYINDRSETGHYYELDTVIGKIDDEKCLVTLFERQTRKSYATITKRGSKYIYQALKNMANKFNLNIKSLTADNGKENVLLHKTIPKGKSLENYTQEEIDFMMEWINNYRKIINQP